MGRQRATDSLPADLNALRQELTDTARDAIHPQLGKTLHRRMAKPFLRPGIGQGAPLPFAHGGQ